MFDCAIASNPRKLSSIAMSKLLEYCFIIFSVFQSFEGCEGIVENQDQFCSYADYEIYRTIINKELGKSDYLIVLRDSTSGMHIDSSSVKYIKERMPDLLNLTIYDFIQKNKFSSKLKKIPGINNLILESEYTGNYKHTVRVTFSRVGYDNSHLQSIVSMSEVYGPLAGSGTLFFLKKENREWEIKNTLLIWIS